MKKFIVAALLVLILPARVFAEDITVAAAANVQFVLEELSQAFQKASGVSVKPVIGSSGKLTTQIENGAPFDLFLSADTEYPETIYQEGLAVSKPKVYAYGILILWTMKDIDLSAGVKGLTAEQVRKIAVANPQTAPYGREAVNAIKYFKLYPALDRKLVYGENVSQVNQFVVSSAADVGFTAKSVVMAENMKGKGVWVEVDRQSYRPMAQAVVLLAYGQKHHGQAAQKFLDFLFTDTAREIFKKYGYILP